MAASAKFPKIICRVKALYAFSSNEKSSLSFEKDEYIEVLSQLDSGWWDGWCKGNRGWFPSNYVQIIDVNPDLMSSEMKNHDFNINNTNGRNNTTSSTSFPPSIQNNDDSEEEAKTINLIRNMSQPSTPTTLSRTHSLNFANSKPVTPPPRRNLPHHQQQEQAQQRHQLHTIRPQIHDDGDDENDPSDLPEGWTLQIADDGFTKFYFNQQTGGLRWHHPGISESDEDGDNEDHDDSSEEDYHHHQHIHPHHNYHENKSQTHIKQYDHFDDHDFGKSSNKGHQMRSSHDFINNNNNLPQTKEHKVNLMEYWIKNTTPQGKIYYGNTITHETTWDYNEIDPSTGRLKIKNADNKNTKISNHKNNKKDDQKLNSSSISVASSLTLVGEEDVPLTWKSIAVDIAQSVQSLNKAVVQGESVFTFRHRIAIVVDAVRLMLYSSRSLDKDVPHLQDMEVKEPHRNVLSTLAKLILSAKVVNDANMDINGKVQRDAADVLNAVRKFVVVCQAKNVQIEQVSPRLLLNNNAIATAVPATATAGVAAVTSTAPSTPVTNSGQDIPPTEEPMSTAQKRKSSTISNATTITNNSASNRGKYALNQDLIVSLQTHAKQIVGSTDALCKASTYVYASEEKQLQKEETQDHENGNKEILNNEEEPVSDQRARSNVVLLFQNLSTQIGNYLAILGDIDTSHVDSTQIQTLPEFRSNKQRLYNSVGLLFSAVQTLTDTQNDLSTCIASIEQVVGMVEDAIEDIFSNVVQMVGERKIWMMRNDSTFNNGDNGPKSPVHAYFETDNKKSPHLSSIDETSENDGNTNNTPMLTRLYNRQGSATTPPHHHRPSISVTPSNLTRPDASALKRQLSFRNGAGAQGDKSQQLWYLGYEYAEGDIVFTQEKTIKGGTLRALVERLTLHDFIDMSFIANFLLTYRSFCTTEEFVELLQERYNLAPPAELTPDELEIWTDKKQKLVRLRVFNVMKNWLENYYNDEDEFILNKLQFFANTVICDSSSFSAEQLNRLIRKRRELDANGGGLKKLIPNTMSGPMPIMPKNIQHVRLLETDPLELARQLTLMDFRLYSSIRPIECLGKAWSNDASNNAVNVKQSIDYCNQLTSWVTGTILSHREAKKRVTVIKYWSHVANRCLDMNNYNTCMAILSAFDNSAIGRLKKTWELVSNRTSQSLAYIRKLMGSNRNFTEYREMIHSVNPPCIPFLGIYLQDLTFIEDGNPDLLKKSSNLINFAKQQKSAEVIREIKQFQSPHYIFQTVPEIQDFIKYQLEASRDVDYLYDRSLEIEPRPTAVDNSG